MWLALIHYRSLPPSSDFGGIADAMTGLLGVGLAGALIGGISVFVAAPIAFRASDSVTSRSIACAVVVLAGVLFFVGVAAFMVFSAVLLHV
jgi:hypothetical protein